VSEIPRFRKSHTPLHGTARAQLLNTGWTVSDVETFLGEPDCIGINGGVRYGTERTYLGGLGIEHIRAVNSGAVSVYEQVTHELVGHFIKHEGFPWLTLVRSDSAETGAIVQVRTRSGFEHAEVTSVYAQWLDLALVRSRRIYDGPAVLE
jgi:hypothetical protein